MALCDTLGVNLPIVQAPVGSAAAPELVAAVSEAGGLGILALTWQSPDVFPAGLLIQDMAAQAVTTIDLLHSSAMR
jgi:NAD(P)H-dependent flavin oxidoreductase YrpB (nitropropane dioxygenase family)